MRQKPQNSYKNKGQNQYRHFVKRFEERIGLKLPKAKYLTLLNKVLTNEFKLISLGRSKRYKFYAIEYNYNQFVGLFDAKTQKLVTVYTKSMFSEKGVKKLNDTYWETNTGGSE